MTFEVGQTERHQVTFSFNRFWGGLSIKVDGVSIVKTVSFASVGLVRHWDFVVGQHEQHQVRIEKHRELAFAGFRPQPVYAFVDGQLVAQGVA
ncbi:hypothetical protein [Cryptosporangium phraense]